MERVNRTTIPSLTKLPTPKPEELFNCLGKTTPQRSMGTTQFERWNSDPSIRELIEKELIDMFQDDRDELRLRAIENILKMQAENKKGTITGEKERKVMRKVIWRQSSERNFGQG